MRVRWSLQIVLGCAACGLLVAGVIWSRGEAGPVDELGWLALALAIVVMAALLGGHAAARAGQPAVLGELVAGLVLGNLPGLGSLDFIGADPYLNILSGIGMLLLMFEVGLDLSVRDLFAVGPSSLLVAVIGTAASLVIGVATAAVLLPASPTATHVFLGAALTATSVGITARVLKDMGAQRSSEARVILGAAVVDDILALVLLGVVASSFAPGRGEIRLAASVAPLVMKTVGFLILAIMLGMTLMPAWFRQASRLQTQGALLAAALCFCFALSWAASSIGLAALVGAFAAGLVLEDAHSALFVQRGERPLGELLQPMTGFLVPLFFVLVGFRADLGALAQPRLLLAPLALAIAAVAGKLCCALGVVHRDVSRLTVAAGMIPRGEVALVFAALGGTLMVGQTPVLDQRGYASIVTVVIVTTLLTPPALKASLRRRDGSHRFTRPAA